MKLAHISDLHIDEQHLAENISKTEMLLKFAADSNADHLIVTGDVSHLSKIRDLQIFRELLDRFGFLHPERLTLTIGNHDIFGGVYLAGDIVDFPKNYRLTNYKAKVQIFVNHFKEAFQNAIPLMPGSPFPFVKPLKNLLLIGLNTNAEHSFIRNFAASNGLVHRTHQHALDRFLKNYTGYKIPKVVLSHHHFTSRIKNTPDRQNRMVRWVENHTMRLINRAEVIRLFVRHKIDLALHGHVHYNEQSLISGIPFLGGGGSLKDDYDGKMKINFIRIDGRHIHTEITDLPTHLPGGIGITMPGLPRPILTR
jgi:3',5'-cyclic AMP phosphodiesterase CpdA